MLFSMQDKTLLEAVKNNDFTTIQIAIDQKKASLNATDPDGNTALHLASLYGHQSIAIALLIGTDKASLNSINKNHETPLTLAVGKNHYVIAQKLLEHNALPDIASVRKPVHIKTLLGYILNFTLLFDFGWIHYQSLDSLRPVGLFLILFFIREALQSVENPIEEITSPLIKAAENNNFAIVNLLLEHQANVNAIDPDSKNTALHLAVQNRNKEMVATLIKAGGHVYLRDKEGYTPLQRACKVHTDPDDSIIKYLETHEQTLADYQLISIDKPPIRGPQLV